MSWRKRWALRVLGINKTADYGIYLVNQHGLTRCVGGPDSVARAIAAEQYDPEIEDDLDCIKPRYTTDSNWELSTSRAGSWCSLSFPGTSQRSSDHANNERSRV